MTIASGTNPIIWADFPDPDVIRVGDCYYMVSTTMHMFPGGAILRSYDLMHWEMASYLYETLDATPGQRLLDGGVYGKGMWAPTIRHHEGVFYVLFAAWDTNKTYLFTARRAEGPWKMRIVEGFYHDASLLFDDDGRVYLAHGNREIWLTELSPDLSGPKPGGLQRLLVRDEGDVRLGYEGSHLYKIGGRYHLFLIHWPNGERGIRTQACFSSDSLEGEFTGGDVLSDDMGYHDAGVAQGGVVDTPDGRWFAMLFQDHGAVGRIPVLVPIEWKHGFAVFGSVPREVSAPSARPEHPYAPLFVSGFGMDRLDLCWQWNHEPILDGWSLVGNRLKLAPARVAANLPSAPNTLTQRAFGPRCEARVTLDASGLREGDCAGLCVLMSHYGWIGVTVEGGARHLVMTTQGKNEADGQHIALDDSPGRVRAKLAMDAETVELMVRCDFRDNADVAEFFYRMGGAWHRLGDALRMHYLLDHFMGARIGLFAFSTDETGGHAGFERFEYNVMED